MYAIAALSPTTNRQLGAFLCADREAEAKNRWLQSMAAQRGVLVKFKTSQDYLEWLQDRNTARLG